VTESERRLSRPRPAKATGSDSGSTSGQDLAGRPSGAGRPAKARALARWLGTATGALSALVTLVLGVLTVVFLLRPALQPGGAPAAFAATLRAPRLEQGVVLSDYYARLGKVPPPEITVPQLGEAGVVVGFDVLLEGFAGQTCRLRWSLVDAATRVRVPEANLVDQPGWPIGTFTPGGNRDQASGEVWVAPPARAGTYLVRLELEDPRGVRLTALDSEPFTVDTVLVPPAAPRRAELPTPAAP